MWMIGSFCQSPLSGGCMGIWKSIPSSRAFFTSAPVRSRVTRVLPKGKESSTAARVISPLRMSLRTPPLPSKAIRAVGTLASMASAMSGPGPLLGPLIRSTTATAPMVVFL